MVGTVNELIENLKENYALTDVLLLDIWNTQDVEEAIEQTKYKDHIPHLISAYPDLYRQILEYMYYNYDAEIGSNWNSMDSAIRSVITELTKGKISNG